MRFLTLISLIAVLSPAVSAQRGGFARSPGFAGRQAFPPSFVGGVGRGGYFHHERGFPGYGYGYGYYPFGYFDTLYPDDVYTAQPPAPQPTVVVVQQPPAQTAPAPVDSSPASSTDPQMIELQGDRYVRVSGDEASTSQMIDQRPLARERKYGPSETMDRASMPSMKPVVLVYRDGHQEEVSDYTITGGVLYTASDYYTAGSWNRKIELSSLNLPETIAFNQTNGVAFHLPSAPNEVVVGP